MRNSVRFLTLIAIATLSAAIQASHAQDTPWQRRLRHGVVLNGSPAVRVQKLQGSLTADEMRRLALRPRGAGLANLAHWPEEPASPAATRAEDLAAALSELCPPTRTRAELERYAEAIVRYGAEFEVDPWLIAALVYTQSDCSAAARSSYGTGLTLINVGMHTKHVHGGHYRFGVRSKRGWTRRELDVSAFRFRRDSLERPAANIYFAAAILRVFQEQCPHIDRAFESVPHRHPVSHFIWGDQVGDVGPEDRILTARRRLLSSHARLNANGEELSGLSLVSPLDGYPRVATSGLGEPRDGGRRPHRGIDVASDEGEPVRAVAAGTVSFAGVDWERRAHIPLRAWGAALVHERHMGPRGLFVEIDHGNGVVSLYAHLGSYDVEIGDRVEAGQRLGEVGRTGIRDSGAHLHFGLFDHGRVIDPLPHLAAYVFPPALTQRLHAELSKPQRRARQRRSHRR